MAAQSSGSAWASVVERCGMGVRTVCSVGKLGILASRTSQSLPIGKPRPARCAGGECAYNRPNFTITAQGVLSVVLALGVQDHRLAERTHRPHVLLAGAGHG